MPKYLDFNNFTRIMHHEVTAIILLIVGFIILLSYNISRISPLTGYDASRHILYIDHMIKGLGVPHLFENGQETYIAHHPPLYYFIASLLITNTQNTGQLKILQFFNLLCTTTFIIFFYLILRELNLPPPIRLLAMFFTVLDETTVIISTMITNEPFSQLMAMVSIYFFVRFIKKSASLNFIAACVFFSLAINSKISHLILFPVYFLLLLINTLRTQKFKQLWLIIPLTVSLLTLYPYIHLNLVRYGSVFSPGDDRPGDVQLVPYLFSFDPHVFNFPFFPTGAYGGYWSHLYGSLFSDYHAHVRPDPAISTGICLTEFTNLSRSIECSSINGYIALVKLGLIVTFTFFLGIIIIFTSRYFSLSFFTALFCSFSYLVVSLSFLIRYPHIDGGVVKTAYILVTLPFFHLLSAFGFHWLSSLTFFKFSLRPLIFIFCIIWLLFSLRAFII